jgi:hypothetical protein
VPTPAVATLLHLQRTAGNRAVAHALDAPPTTAALQALGSASVATGGERTSVAGSGIAGSPSAEVSSVPLYDSPSSHAAAARLGVHAYTYRGRIALGAGLDETHGPGRGATVAHELVHARQMQVAGPATSAAQAESAARSGRADVRADPETPHGLFWVIPAIIGGYILLRPKVANAPTPADVAAGRVQESVSDAQIVGEALALFAVPGGVAGGLARAGYGVVTAMAVGGAASAVSYRGVQDVGAGEFSGVQAYVVDATTGAVIGAVIGGAVRLYGGPQALGPARPNPNLVHFTTEEAQQAILATAESGQPIGQLRGGTGIWALSDDALQQAPWVRAARATMPVRTAQAAVPVPPEAAGQFSRAVPIGPVSAYQYAMGVYRAPAGAIAMANGQFTPAAGGILPNIKGLIFPYGADAAIWISAAALSGPPSATAEERGIRGLLPSLPAPIRPVIESQTSMRETERGDGPFVMLPGLLSEQAAIAGAQGSYDPVAEVCLPPETNQSTAADPLAPQPAIIYVAPYWPTDR